MRLLLSALLVAAGVTRPAAPVSAVNPLLAGESVQLRSNILNEDRALFISKPAGYETGSERYPVLYLLDGESHFRYVSGMVEFMATSERIPGMLVVGIGSEAFGQRTRDLTPASTSENDARFAPGNGGADRFLSFLENELIPFIDKNCRTKPYRVLAGHSYGGLFAIHALTTRPKLFNAWIAIDPSLSWDNGSVVGRAESFFSKTAELQADLYLSASNSGGKMPRGVRRLAAVLDEKAPARFRWNFEWMKEETHGSIPLRSMHQGLDTIFDGWHLTDPRELFEKGGIQAIHRHFQEGGRRYGCDRKTPASTVSLIVAALISDGHLEEASDVLLHDPTAFPAPWNQLDALARAYAGRGDVARAIHYYQMSLKENPRNDWAKRKLREWGVAR